MRAEIDHIRALLPDPKRRAEAALHLVQDKVRYLYLSASTGGYVPAAADETWSRRFGDCKGKTVLLLALLHGLGLDAIPVLVSTSEGDGLDAQVPTIGRFNHVMVRLQLDGHFYWLERYPVGRYNIGRAGHSG